MRSVAQKAALCAVVVGVGLLHFAVFSISYVQAHVDPSPNAGAWSVVATVLSVPLVTLAQLVSHVDLFPLAAFTNSVLWGVGCAVLIAKRQTRASSGSS